MGPLLFHWSVEKWRDFYARVADEAPVDVVCLGEVVCSKRLPFYTDAIAETADRLQRGGKTVVLSGLSMVTLLRERKDCAALACNESFEVEVNDISALTYLNRGRSFRIGPLVNVYSNGTLEFLANYGASSVCLPPELSISAVEPLARTARALGMNCEIWSFGRIPLALSGRCYHARLAGTTKDSCQFVCSRDSDGLDVRTTDGKEFLAINGVQTLSHAYCNTIGDVDRLIAAGVTSLRLSPHSCDMIEISQTFRNRLDGRIGSEEALARIGTACGPVTFANGFLFGEAGVEMTHPISRPKIADNPAGR